MSTSDTIALAALIVSTLALIVSIVVGIANATYTHRQFRAQTVPTVVTSLRAEKPAGTTAVYLNLGLKNASSSLTITDLHYSIRFASSSEPARKMKWHTYYSGTLATLDPLTTEWLSTYRADGVSEFLADRFPSIVHKSDDPGRRFKFDLLQAQTFQIEVSMDYLSGVAATPRAKVVNSYIGTPSKGSIEDPILWEMQRAP
jgi:hypothetical protein